ncbi:MULTISPECIES: DUF3467 domain-containing protein [Myroides]|uniref:DUF3467 domain-containing protein n=1 Tax=Myroides albus TaxID=2562892 RepID=A0A6I3LJ93_9FLAO|nr:MULTISPECIES: DUF3467 domain-containing protein [Myroides]MTG97260.1 DUF3467 domain-containing protein [Myroides albus]MVX34279.1 DUF3467 domain-containing protein [Myroides sp. LoEW2-1]UVD80652.1 DUF3467 domain-containing protein [Myroides albus]
MSEDHKFDIELDELTAEGTFSNLAIINHSNTEFVVDFASVMPGVPKAKVKSRIILTPHHAKRLANALLDNLQRFEAANGEINDSGSVFDPNSVSFGPKGKA